MRRSPADRTWYAGTWCFAVGALAVLGPLVWVATLDRPADVLTIWDVQFLAICLLGATVWFVAGAILRGIARLLDALEEPDDDD